MCHAAAERACCRPVQANLELHTPRARDVAITNTRRTDSTTRARSSRLCEVAVAKSGYSLKASVMFCRRNLQAINLEPEPYQLSQMPFAGASVGSLLQDSTGS